LGADLGPHHASAGRRTGTGLEFTELGLSAVRVGGAALRLRIVVRVAFAVAAGAPLVRPHASLQQLALVGVGLAVAAADRRALLRAGFRHRDTDARQVRGVALAEFELARLP